MKHIVLLIVCLFFFSELFTQESNTNMYYDEIGKTVTKETFNKKLDSKLFHAVNFTLRDTVHNKNQWSYFFGKLEQIEKEKLNKYFKDHKSIDTTRIIAIHYQDTLKTISSFSKKDTLLFVGANRDHKHLITHKTFLKTHRSCLKSFEKHKQSNAYHFYGINEGHPEEIEELKWYRDKNKLILKTFGINLKSSKVILIHPDGNYFVYIMNDLLEVERLYKKLLKNKGWEREIKKFNKALQQLND